MNKNYWLLFFCCIVFITHAQKFDVYITNINIIPITKDTILKNQCVGIQGNRILYIGKDIKAPAFKKINGTNKYLMPSMYDMHIHWPDIEPKRYLQLCLAAGITKVRVMNSKPEAIDFKKASFNKSFPALSIGFPIRETSINKEEDIPLLIDSIKNKGYDFIKIYNLAQPNYFSVIMKEAAKKNLTVCGHALDNISAKEALTKGYKSVEHLGYLDVLKDKSLDSAIQLFVSNNTFICPTLDWEMMVYHSYPYDSLKNRIGYNEGYNLYKKHWDTTYLNTTNSIPETKRKMYADYMLNRVQNKIQLLKKIHETNINLIAGSDAEEPFQTPGFSIMEELLLIQKGGYSNYELLKTVTYNAALYFNEEKLFGSIEQNKEAHLLILNKNPLDDIKNLESIETILFNNTVIDKADLLKKIK